MVAISLLLACFVTLVVASPTKIATVLHERRESVPAGFKYTDRASPDALLSLRMALTSTDKAGLEAALMDVSVPSSKNYGKHLTKEKVAEYIKPQQTSVDIVNDFFKANGIEPSTLTTTGDWVSFSIPVSKANKLFDADFSVFTHVPSGKQSIRTLSYSLPVNLKGHVDLVHPTVTFSNPSPGLPVISSPSPPSNGTFLGNKTTSCATTITPACLQSLYSIPTTLSSASSSQIGVAAFIDQYANKADLKSFLKAYRPDLPSTTTFTLETLDDGSNSQKGSKAGTEANLDIQYTVGLATDVPVTFISVGDDYQDGELEGFLDIINYLLAQSSPPQVLTTSYGDNEDNISRALSEKLCNAYAQLGARGTSILFASGDGGVSGSQSSSCSKFVPTFPSGCPYLTSVGAVTGVSPETGSYFSAGGFSNYFDIPSYQSEAVQSYISSLGSTYKGKYNASGRGYPDVAAQGENFAIFVDGQQTTVDGTSCASPTFASVIGTLNAELLAAGKSPLGFLNPFLYSTGLSALTDITSGTNPGCNTNGFSAKTGWDPITGLGTPNFAALLTAAGL